MSTITHAAWIASALLVALLPIRGAATPSVDALACTDLVASEQEVQAVCIVPASTAPQALRFKAHFLGSHDDSKVSLHSITLDEAPVACGAGSKLGSTFEDGEVTLDCALPTPARASTGKLKVAISLHHLQLSKTELVSDGSSRSNASR